MSTLMHTCLVKGLGRGVKAPLPLRSRTKVNGIVPDASHLSTSLQNLHIVHLFTLADIESVASSAQPAVQEAVNATTAVDSGAGPFDSLAKVFEASLQVIDGGLEKLSIPYSYGFSIILLTLLVKVATFPLTQKQVESTLAVQALAPSVKELQTKHANDPERLQLETAKLYKDANVNPLAGCLPTLATIPVFIGLYRALTLAAQDGLLNEGFFFIPSLGGPATIDQQMAGQGMSWLLPFVDGVPPLGWATTAKYLALPILLVASQYASMSISQPANSDDPQVKQTQAILRYLPIMIGWFSLNVPSGLTIYWLTNNILTTAQQVYLKKVTKVNIPKPRGTVINVPAEEVPASSAGSPVPAAASGGSSEARRSKKGETFRARQASERATTIAKNPRGKKKGKKFAERKQAENSSSSGAAAPELSPVAAHAQAKVESAARAVAGEVVVEAPAAVGKPSAGDAARTVNVQAESVDEVKEREGSSNKV